MLAFCVVVLRSVLVRRMFTGFTPWRAVKSDCTRASDASALRSSVYERDNFPVRSIYGHEWIEGEGDTYLPLVRVLLARGTSAAADVPDPYWFNGCTWFKGHTTYLWRGQSRLSTLRLLFTKRPNVRE